LGGSEEGRAVAYDATFLTGDVIKQEIVTVL